jgi:hypothetical protein
MEGDDIAGFHFQGDHPEHLTRLVTDQIQRHPFDEELGIGAHVALIERVQHRVASTVGGGAGTPYRLLAEVRHVPAERALVDLAFVGAVKGMPKCSSSTTTSGAMRHMYSIASWSPSQSEPLTVSYMCQCQ